MTMPEAFITCVSGDGKYRVDIKTRTLSDAQAWHDLVLSVAASDHSPSYAEGYAAAIKDAAEKAGAWITATNDPCMNCSLELAAAIRALSPASENLKRQTFEVPPGYEAVRDADGRATGAIRPITAPPRLLDGEREAVKIKPLEWASPSDGRPPVAQSPWGEYAVWEIGGAGYWLPPGGASGHYGGKTIADAKAAAQANYEARIRSALSPASDAPGDGER